MPRLAARCAALLIALALYARIAVPAGFMLSPAARGGAPLLVLCTGKGAMQMPMPGHGKDDGKVKDSCPFAAAAAALDVAPEGGGPAVTADFAAVPQPPMLSTRPGRGLAAPPPPPTGPPTLA